MKGARFQERRRAVLQFMLDHTPIGFRKPDFKRLSHLAIDRGLYSHNTTAGDVEGAMRRIWTRNTRKPLITPDHADSNQRPL